MIHVKGVPSSVPPTVVVLAVGSGLRKRGRGKKKKGWKKKGFRIRWSELDGSDSQYERDMRLQMDERDEEDE